MMHTHVKRWIGIFLLAALVPACGGGSSVTTHGPSAADPLPGSTWTWISGTNSDAASGSYGIQGIPAPGNFPGNREGAVTWVDLAGNLWLFGGLFFSGIQPVLNDLWKFDGTSWTWVSGSNTPNQVGTYSGPGPLVPGARWRAHSWTDPQGNFWLFGGDGYDSASFNVLNDLWKFDGTNWTIVSGSTTGGQKGSFGTLGLVSSSNVPSSRASGATWADLAGNLWLFGGIGIDGTGAGTVTLNDLWKFDGVHWTWLSGSLAGNQPGSYGTRGIPNASNVPGARYGGMSFIDPNGLFWLFGGEASTNGAVNQLFNDLWTYDGATWTWVSGSDLENQPAILSPQGKPYGLAVPGARQNAAAWIDFSGHLWVFGGYGYTNLDTPGDLNDLWMFNGTEWAWISGSTVTNQFGVYGTEGVPGAGNIPGSRYYASAWTDHQGRFWLFGGVGLPASEPAYNTLNLNDLWRTP